MSWLSKLFRNKDVVKDASEEAIRMAINVLGTQKNLFKLEIRMQNICTQKLNMTPHMAQRSAAEFITLLKAAID